MISFNLLPQLPCLLASVDSNSSYSRCQWWKSRVPLWIGSTITPNFEFFIAVNWSFYDIVFIMPFFSIKQKRFLWLQRLKLLIALEECHQAWRFIFLQALCKITKLVIVLLIIPFKSLLGIFLPLMQNFHAYLACQ